MQPVWYTYYNISNQKIKCTKTIFLRKVSLNFSEIAMEDDKDEDKASLPDTEVGEVEAENAEKNVEEETPETAAKQGETEMDTTVQEDKNDTTVQGDNMDIQYK